MYSSYVEVFFFQAEDGIRDDLVTGVQTCALPIFRRQNVGGWSRQFFPAEKRWRHLMAFIFGTQIAGESDDHPKLTGASLPRLCQSCPLDGDLGRNVVLPSRLGEGGKAFQVRTLVPQDETSCPANSQIGLNSSGQHGYTSGQGWAICFKDGTSTLA